MSRNKPSLLAKLLTGMIEDKELNKPALILDWGCGRGGDVKYYKEQGFAAFGWDPHYESVMAPEGTKFDVVTCAYVLNVIDNPEDRINTLREAKKHLRKHGHVLVCARSHSDIEYQAATSKWRRKGNGYITKSGTFQMGLSNNDLVFALNFAGFEVIDTNAGSKNSWALGRKK